MSNADAMAIWRSLTPQQRDYDRFVARKIPFGASWRAETSAGQMLKDEIMMADLSNSECCSCHVSAPCSHCLDSSGE